MKLLSLAQGDFEVFAACTDRGACPLLRLLGEMESDGRKDAIRMLALLKRVSREGLPARYEVNHRLVGGISQLRQGGIRVLYFQDRNRVIICTHGFVKRSQKTPALEISRAQATLARFQQDLESGKIEILSEERA